MLFTNICVRGFTAKVNYILGEGEIMVALYVWIVTCNQMFSVLEVTGDMYIN